MRVLDQPVEKMLNLKDLKMSLAALMQANFPKDNAIFLLIQKYPSAITMEKINSTGVFGADSHQHIFPGLVTLANKSQSIQLAL